MVEASYNVTSHFVRTTLEQILAVVTLKCFIDITMRRKKDVPLVGVGGGAGMVVRKVFPSLITVIFPGAASGGSKPAEGACHLRNLPSCNYCQYLWEQSD
jgi:hypothetical protein